MRSGTKPTIFTKEAEHAVLDILLGATVRTDHDITNGQFLLIKHPKNNPRGRHDQGP